MIHSTLTNSMSVSDLAPKAATKLPETTHGDGAFEEALAGAHTVRDQRDGHASERGLERGRAIGTTDRPRVSNDDTHDTDGAAHTRHAKGTEHADHETAAAKADAAGTEHAEAADGADAATGAADAAGAANAQLADAAAADATAASATAGTVAVAAAPVADLDAIIVPTAAAVTAAAPTDAVDAAMRLAIDAGAGAATADASTDVDAAAEATTATPVATTAAADAATAVTAATLRGAEDIEVGDATAGQTSPVASTPAATSGPSPVQSQLQATATTEVAPDATPTDVAVQAVATASVADVASGDAAAAGAVATVQEAVAADASTTTDDTATLKAGTLDAQAKAAASTTTTDDAGTADVQVVDAEAPQVAQVARNVQGQSTTVAANAQFQAQVQAKVAEQHAEEGSPDAAAPTKVDATSLQSVPLEATRSGNLSGAGVRVQEGLLGAGQQARIDHIAEQLATRLKLSQASGGTQVQLNLKPRELGEVSVQMHIRDGVVAATVLVDRAETLDTLQTNLDDLKKSLENQGLSIQEFSVDVRGDSGAGGANARAAADLRHSATRTSSGSAASLAGAAAVIPGLMGDREVDPDAIHDGDVSVLA
ncbi:MAG: Flagellar hook-length control protein FliK [Thermoleophilia bacterium]|nr:Flagellar hook-length control protein FliK [Thermoleophilia bacterium]